MANAGRHLTAAVASVTMACGAVALRAESSHVHLTFDTAHALAPAIRRTALAEATRIWNVYGVTIDADDSGGCDPANPHVLRVTIDPVQDTTPGDGEAGLGAIRFGADGTPASALVLHLGAIAHVATSAPFMGLHPSLWPATLREEIVGRATGRALAHEIGHYLLRSPHHSDSGLMRARQKASALGSLSGRPFLLDKVAHDRLRIALAAPLFARASPLDASCPVASTR